MIAKETIGKIYLIYIRQTIYSWTIKIKDFNTIIITKKLKEQKDNCNYNQRYQIIYRTRYTAATKCRSSEKKYFWKLKREILSKNFLLNFASKFQGRSRYGPRTTGWRRGLDRLGRECKVEIMFENRFSHYLVKMFHIIEIMLTLKVNWQ